jgi:hypothetical protein
MSILVKYGRLASTVGSAGTKTVAVMFTSQSCASSQAIKPFWEAISGDYKTVVFCTVELSECPSECREYKISTTPTFLFILNCVVIDRYSGADKKQLKALIEKHKGAGAFSGTGRSLAAPPPPPVQPQREVLPPIAEGVRGELTEMGFDEATIERGYRGTNGGDVAAIVDFIEKEQQAAQQNPQQAALAELLQKPLDAKGEAARAHLVSLGYDSDLAAIAVNSAGPDDVSGCVAVIQKILRGESIPAPKPRKTQAEIEAQLAHYKELLAQKRAAAEEATVAPPVAAKSELERRREVQEAMETKRKLAEAKAEADRRAAEKARIQDKLDRERALKRIAEQRAKNTPAPPPPVAQEQAPAQPKAAAGEATVRINLPDGTNKIAKFPPGAKLRDMEKWVRANVAGLQGWPLTYEIPFPKAEYGYPDMDSTLESLGIRGRAQINLKRA